VVRIAVFLLLVALLLPSAASAQLVRDHEGEGGVRGFHGPATAGHIRRSFQSDADARAEFERILSAVGLTWITDRVALRASAETPNAEAGIGKNGERFIFYNALFMQKLRQRTTDDWSLVSILAHEVGHHLAFHTEVDGRWHEFELEADYFSGFVLRRLGVTLDQALAGLRAIGPKQASQTHPGLDQRLQAIAIGWTDGGAHGPPRGLKKTDEKAPSAVAPGARPELPPPPAPKKDARSRWQAGQLAGLLVHLEYGQASIDQQAGRELARLLRDFGSTIVAEASADVTVRQRAVVARSEGLGKRMADVTISLECFVSASNAPCSAPYVASGSGEGPNFEIAVERALRKALDALERRLRGAGAVSRP
jgi:hypothetical protein